MKKEKKRTNSPGAVICSALGTLLLIVLIIACIPFTLPRFLDYQAYTVISGSMEPAISVGSLVYVKYTEPEDVAVSDVIAYYGGRDRNAITTHRVEENRVIMGEFITKGDANQTVDMNPVLYEDFIGRVELTIPKLGVLAGFMTSLQGKVMAGGMIIVAVVLHLMASLFQGAKKRNRYSRKLR